MPTDPECESCGATGADWVQTAAATWDDPAEYEAICDDCAEGAAREHDAFEAAREDHADAQREMRREETRGARRDG